LIADNVMQIAAQGIIPSLPRSLKMGSAGKGVTGVHNAGEV